MSENKKDKKDSSEISGIDLPLKDRVEEMLLEGNWKVMYTVAKDGGSTPSDSDGGSGGSGGSNSSSSDSGSSGGCNPG